MKIISKHMFCGAGRRVPLTAALLFLCSAGYSRAQSLPFEDKARYEKMLEQKTDEVLLRLLGPNQAKVVIDASMDFNRTEKMEVSPGTQADKNLFKWQGTGGAIQSGDYLMPGFPVFDPGAAENRSYSRQLLYPSAFVKRLTVSIIVNRDLPVLDAENLRKVVSEILMLDPRRGDQLSVIKTPFAPLWRTIWYTPEAISLVLKYVMLGLMGIIAIIVVAVGFLKLADAMSTMARVQQNHQITMDLGAGTAPAGLDGTQPGIAGPPDRQQLCAPENKDAAGGQKLQFNVRPDQVHFLVKLMADEDPANVALVADHLPQEVRAEFIKKLAPAFSSDVIINMAKIRFVEPEVIVTLKDELERRLNGAVGGLDGALEAIEDINLRTKLEMLAELGKKNPELAAEVRRQVLLPEDIGKFSDREFSLLAGALKAEQWGAALSGLPDVVRGRLKALLTEKAWMIIEQSVSYGAPSREKTEEALEQVMAAVSGLIKEGKIIKPTDAPRPQIVNAPSKT